MLSDGTYDAGAAVNTATDTITFSAPHGLVTGNSVVFHANGGAAGTNNGLTDGRRYTVIVSGDKALMLGAEFLATPQSVDTLTDTITFPGAHGLETGDKVTYYVPSGSTAIGGLVSGQQYEVFKVDDARLKLRPVGSSTTGLGNVSGSSISGTTVTATNPFHVGDAVTYHYVSDGRVFQFSSTLADAVVSGDPQRITPNDNNEIILTESGVDHNIQTGDALIYHANGTPISPLVDGGIYYAIRLDGQRIKLATSRCRALGSSIFHPECYLPDGPDDGDDPDPQPVVAINLAPDKSDPVAGGTPTGRAVTHSLTKVQDQALFTGNPAATPDSSTGLVDGRVYFVVAVASDGSSFQLSKTLGGPAMALNPNGYTGGRHQFFIEGINLTSPGSGRQDVVLDLTGGSGTKQLESGGTANFVGAPSGDRIVTASAAGGGGGFIDVRGANSTASTSPSITLSIGGTGAHHRRHDHRRDQLDRQLGGALDQRRRRLHLRRRRERLGHDARQVRGHDRPGRGADRLGRHLDHLALGVRRRERARARAPAASAPGSTRAPTRS